MAPGNPSPRAAPARKRSSVSGIAIVLVAAGALVLWNNIGGFGPKNLFRIALTYWPTVIIGIGISKVFFDPRKRVASGIAFLLLGGFLQLLLLDWLPGDIGDTWPVMFLLAGLWLLLVPPGARGAEVVEAEALALDELFAARSMRMCAEGFSGGVVAATLSSLKIDLTGCAPAGRIVLSCDILLARVEIVIPAGWRLTVEASPTFGRIAENGRQTVVGVPSAAPELVLGGTVTLGRIFVRRT